MKFISPYAHSIIGFVMGAALLLAPDLLGFSGVGGAAVLIPRVLGVIVVLSELTVRGSFSNIGVVPMKAHIVMDIVLGAFLALSPWLFRFAGEKSTAWVPHVLVGTLMIGYALATRTDGAQARTHEA